MHDSSYSSDIQRERDCRIASALIFALRNLSPSLALKLRRIKGQDAAVQFYLRYCQGSSPHEEKFRSLDAAVSRGQRLAANDTVWGVAISDESSRQAALSQAGGKHG